MARRDNDNDNNNGGRVRRRLLNINDQIDSIQDASFRNYTRNIESRFQRLAEQQARMISQTYDQLNREERQRARQSIREQQDQMRRSLDNWRRYNNRMSDDLSVTERMATQLFYWNRRRDLRNLEREARYRFQDIAEDGEELGDSLADSFGSVADSLREWGNALNINSIANGLEETTNSTRDIRVELQKNLKLTDEQWSAMKKNAREFSKETGYAISNIDYLNDVSDIIIKLGIDDTDLAQEMAKLTTKFTNFTGVALDDQAKMIETSQLDGMGGIDYQKLLSSQMMALQQADNLWTSGEDLMKVYNENIDMFRDLSNGNRDLLNQYTNSSLALTAAGNAGYIDGLDEKLYEIMNMSLSDLADQMAGGQFYLGDVRNLMQSGQFDQAARAFIEGYNQMRTQMISTAGMDGWKELAKEMNLEGINESQIIEASNVRDFFDAYDQAMGVVNEQINAQTKMIDEWSPEVTFGQKISNWWKSSWLGDKLDTLLDDLNMSMGEMFLGLSAIADIGKLFTGNKGLIGSIRGLFGGGGGAGGAGGGAGLLGNIGNFFRAGFGGAGANTAAGAAGMNILGFGAPGGMATLGTGGAMSAGLLATGAMGAGGLAWMGVDAYKGTKKAGEWLGREDTSAKVISGVGGALGGTGPGWADEGSVGDKAKNTLAGAGKGALIGGAIGSIVPGLGTAIGAAIGGGVGAIASAIGGEKISQAIDWVGEKAGQMWDKTKEVAGKAWEGIKDFGSSAWEKTKEVASGAWEGIKGFASGAWEKAKGFATGAWDKAKNLGIDAFNTAVGVGDMAMEGLFNAMGLDWDGFKGKVSEGWNNIKEWGTETWSNISGWASEKWEGLKTSFSEGWNNIKEWGSSTWDSISSWASEKWNGIKDKAKEVWSGISDWASEKWDGIKEKASVVWDKTKEVAGKAWDGIKEKASQTWDDISTKASKAWDGIKDAGKKAWDGIKGFASDAWDGITGFFNGARERGESITGIDGSHKNGLDTVPKDGYIAELHKNEAVLTAEQAKQWRAEQNGNAASNFFHKIYKTAKYDRAAMIQNYKNAMAAATSAGKAWDGIKDAGKKAWDGIKGFASDAWDGITGFFNGARERGESITGIDGSHKNGLDTVPKDGYIAELHKNEAVLTAEQAKQWRAEQNGNAASNFFHKIYKTAKYDRAAMIQNYKNAMAAATSAGSAGAGTGAGSGDYSGVNVSGTGKDSVWKALRSMGYSKESTAGIMGNMHQESGVEANKIQGNGRGPAAGIVQWENYNTKSGRWKAMADYAASKGRDWTDLQSQLEYLDKEMRGADSCTLALLKKKVGGYEQFKALNDIDKATLVFEESFERAGTPAMANRYSAARSFYKQFSSYDTGTPWVPNDQVALIHKGEMIVPADSNPYNKSNSSKVESTGNDDGSINDLIQVVKQGISRLESAINNGTKSTNYSLANLARGKKVNTASDELFSFSNT